MFAPAALPGGAENDREGKVAFSFILETVSWAYAATAGRTRTGTGR